MAVSKSTTFSESNISIINNTSTLTITVYFSPNNTQTFFYDPTALNCTCNGVTKTNYVTLQKGGSVTSKFVFENIPHNDDGTKTVSWKWNCNTGTSVLGNISDSGTRALTTIPRASDLTCSSPVTMGTTQSVNVVQKSANFSHILYYKTSLDSDWTEIGRNTSALDSTYSWNVPDITAQIPNSNSDTYTLRVITYLSGTYEGDTLETLLNVVANVPDSYVPTIQITNVVEGNSAIPSTFPFLVGYSKPNITTRFIGSAGSTVVNRGVRIGNEIIASQSSSQDVSMQFINALTQSTNNVYATTTDSRGRVGTATETISAYAYQSPNVQMDYTRCDDDGIVNQLGEYLAVKLKWTYDSVGSKNSATIKIYINDTLKFTYTPSVISQQEWLQVAILDNIDIASQYDIRVVIEDLMTNAVVSGTVAKALVPYSAFDDDNNLGFALGRMATEEGLRNYMNEYVTSGKSFNLLDTNGRQVLETIAMDKIFEFVDDTTMNTAIQTAIDGFKKWETLWTGTCKGRETISLDVSSYSKLKIYAVSWGATLIGELDLTKTMPNNIFSGYPYCACFTGAQYVNTSKVWEIHSIMVAVNTAKNTIYNGNQGFAYNTTNELRNNNSQYYIYKVEGMK